jgi:molybdopterin-guanine dinucleotide biosynthesis protein
LARHSKRRIRNSLVTVDSTEMVVWEREVIVMKESPEEFEDRLPVIVVAGVTSGAGKTSLAEAMVRVLSERYRTGAAKITVTHGELGCPHGGKGCDVCGSLGGNFQVITREDIISQAGTDTARLKTAGASKVLWTITREQFVGDAWSEMRSFMKDAQCVVVESNTLALVIKPQLTLMIADPTVSRRLWKPSAERLIAEADYLIFNDRGPEPKRVALMEEIKRLRDHPVEPLFLAHPHEISTQEPFMHRLHKLIALSLTSDSRA